MSIKFYTSLTISYPKTNFWLRPWIVMWNIHRRIQEFQSWRGHSSCGGIPDPWMAVVSLPSRFLGRKNKEIGAFLLKRILGHLGRGCCPLFPSPLVTPMERYLWPVQKHNRERRRKGLTQPKFISERSINDTNMPDRRHVLWPLTHVTHHVLDLWPRFLVYDVPNVWISNVLGHMYCGPSNQIFGCMPPLHPSVCQITVPGVRA